MPVSKEIVLENVVINRSYLRKWPFSVLCNKFYSNYYLAAFRTGEWNEREIEKERNELENDIIKDSRNHSKALEENVFCLDEVF